MQKLLRLQQIIGDRRASPLIEPIIPVSRATWYRGVSDGRYPKPVRLGPHTVAWRSEDIHQLREEGCKIEN